MPYSKKSHPSAEWMTFFVFPGCSLIGRSHPVNVFSLNYPQASDLWVFYMCFFFFCAFFCFCADTLHGKLVILQEIFNMYE